MRLFHIYFLALYAFLIYVYLLIFQEKEMFYTSVSKDLLDVALLTAAVAVVAAAAGAV